MIKKTIITLGIVLIYIVSFSQQITNGNFENWTDQYNASGWNSLNNNDFNYHSAEQTTDFYQGSFALKLESKSVFGIFFPGVINLGEIDIENQLVTGGIPFEERPTGLSYFFKYLPQGGDTSYMMSILTKWNTATESTDTIGMTAYLTANEIVNYSQVNVPYIYNSEEIPDTLNVLFLSSGFTGTIGSILQVDSVSLLYGSVISPTLSFPASDTTYNSLTTRCLSIPTASSYKLDVSESNNFASFILGYEDLDIGTDTFAVVDVTAGLYFYRKRVNYGTETSINSNTIAVPMPILNLDATDISSNSFTANWQAANNATNYYIDVATDANFTNIVDGYSNLSVGNVTSYLIENLNSETEYFYRVRTEYDTYTSKNSNTISVNTAVGIKDLISQSLNVYSDKNSIIIYSRSEYLPNDVVVYNMQGQQIVKVLNVTSYETIKLEKQGVYIVSLKFNDFVISKKVVLLF